MGNRAVIQMSKDGKYNKNNLAIYVHWNGGLDSVKAYLIATKELMNGRNDFDYCCARLVQVITTFHIGNISVGLDLSENLDEDNFDNGVYIINMQTLEISQRLYEPIIEQKNHGYQKMAEDILEKLKLLESPKKAVKLKEKNNAKVIL
ncbi:hypothetical protein [uncultured Gammaproteobacteria bacterium]|jgi:hypothetical protein|nr:hypothetical protein [uncultured Gammaproteobacteria bacterium]CAC9566560.1 hypothetical protein [uncultured Gammaproteobacteria bacterium]CAC9569042.1 hypothetical protein [uncultured Gammaproteobacteria bacterium]CAC9602465.1 hypothetical protein [uncultured Gammaproteobacteria bacterium]CAC9957996.1 hypothetical protein [uncultured Gammaproteobacteria bacterium]